MTIHRMRVPLTIGLLSSVAVASALTLAAPALASTTTAGAPDESDCVSLQDGRFAHHFDAEAQSLTVEFVPSDAGEAGKTLCDGGQAFTVVTWALESVDTISVPQRKVDAVEKAVTVAGQDGSQTITATSAGECAVQVDGYMTAASDVPDVLTGFSGKDGGNEPPLVNQKSRTPYPSDGNAAYTVAGEQICTLPVEIVAKSECVEGVPVSGAILTSTNPWEVSYTITVDGEPLTTSEPVPPVAPGTPVAVALAGLTGTYTLTATDENGVDASVEVTSAECPAGSAEPTTTVPESSEVPTTEPSTTEPSTTEPSTTVPATSEAPTTESSTAHPSTTHPSTTVPATAEAPATTLQPVVAPATTFPSSGATADLTTFSAQPVAQRQLAYTGSPVGRVLLSGLGLLVLGAGLTVVSRRRR